MAQKKSFTWLFVLLAFILAVFVALHIYEKMATKPQDDFAPFDITEVTKFTLQPPYTSSDVIFQKDGDRWFVSINGEQYLADQQNIHQILSDFLTIKPEKIEAEGVQFFEYYQVDVESALQATAKSGEKILRDMLIGKADKQENGETKTFIRIGGKSEIYAVDGFLHLSFQKSPAFYRNKNLLNLSHQKMEKVEYYYPNEKPLIFEPLQDRWLVNGKEGNSEEINKFIGNLGFVMSSNFVDPDSITLPESPQMKLRIYGDDKEFTLQAYEIDGVYYATSSYDTLTLWNASINDLFQRIFPNKERLMKND